MDARERVGDGHLPIGERKCLEVVVRARVGAFAQVQQQAGTSFQVGEKFRRIPGDHVGDLRVGGGHVRPVGGLRIAYQASVKTHDAGVTEERDSLRCGDASQQTFAFDIADDCLGKSSRFAENIHRATDELSVVGVPRPIVAVGENVRHRPNF